MQSSLRVSGAGSSWLEPAALSLEEREVVCAVLEDSVNQLAVLGGIMPDYSATAAAVEHVSPSSQSLSLSLSLSLLLAYRQWETNCWSF